MFIFANNRQTKQTVNKNAAILIALWSVCISYATSIFAATNPNRLDTLKVFVQKKILYNEEIPVDSVICWSESILPDIRKNKQDKTTYFLLQLQLANAYTLRGDISLAIDRARLMYEEAKEMEYDFGMVVANQAIGDAYTIGQPMRQSAGILSGRFERAASYISAPPLPHTTTAEAVQHLTT